MDIINVTVLVINCRYFIVKSMFVIKRDNWPKHFVACFLELYVFKWIVWGHIYMLSFNDHSLYSATFFFIYLT